MASRKGAFALLKVKIWNFGGGLKSYEDLLLTRWRSLMADKVATTINLQDTVSAYNNRLYSSKELQSSLVYVSPVKNKQVEHPM
ncbi:hypothetical protein G6F68_018532 [Rhizopus microsporus]|nr:hypothetical protein G6F68_018532 [Rhizopus microsporus]